VSAATLSQTVTLNVKEKSITQVFTAIEAQTGYLIVYNDRYVTKDLLVSLNVKDHPLEDVLKKILISNSLAYQIKGKTIAVRGKREQSTDTRDKTPSVIESQQRTITGMVADQDGNPLQAVTVSLKGTTISTTTDEGGTYYLTLSSDAHTLVFTAVGYKATETFIGSQNVVNISLTPAVSDLDEVVVVGCGTP